MKIRGEKPSHVIMPGNLAEQKIQKDILECIQKEIYDAALLDGCDEIQTQLTAY